MGFRQGAYATCWSIENKGKFTKIRLAISRKNRETGQYEQDFSGYCMFIGNAHAKAAQLRESSRIKLGDVDVSNTYDKETKKEYVNYKVFSFDMADEGGSRPAAKPVDSNPVEGDVDEDEIPI